LNGANGHSEWQYQIPAPDCTTHAVADPTVADYDATGVDEVLAATTENKLIAYDPLTGDVEFEHELTSYGYTKPIVVATARGGLVAMVDGDAIIVWERELGSFAAVNAAVDGDGDGSSELYAVAKDGILYSLAASDGTTEWTTTLTTADVQMMPPPSVGDVDGDGAVELVAPTNDGIVSVVDPRSGEIVWTYEREDTIYTHPTLADIDGDGDVEAFVIYRRGRVVAFDFGRRPVPTQLPFLDPSPTEGLVDRWFDMRNLNPEQREAVRDRHQPEEQERHPKRTVESLTVGRIDRLDDRSVDEQRGEGP
jgi:outer membrane protein assembly factor BamB